MKILTAPMLAMAVLLALPAFVFAQVFNGNLILSTQAEVNAFHYKKVNGHLTIGYEDGTTLSNIKNLQPLSILKKVEFTVIIRNNNLLQDLKGLEKLTSAIGLIVENNASLTSLKSLTKLGGTGSFQIINNDLLKNLQGLEKFTSGGEVIIIENDQLQNLQGLENISSIGYLDIDNNGQLQDIKGLKNLRSAPYLKIRNNAQLQSLQGLEKITSIGGGLFISNNDQLQDLQGLDNLTGIGVTNNSSNVQLQDLPAAHSSGMDDKNTNKNGQNQRVILSQRDLFYGLRISDNDQLKNLKGLDNLTKIQGYPDEVDVSISGNASLTSLQGLNKLSSVGSDFSIGENPTLVSLEGLDNLTYVRDYFYIGLNDKLKNLKGLESFTVADGIVIQNNPQLENLEGIDNAISVNDVSITDNPILTSVSSLKNNIGLSKLTLRNNPKLDDCCAIADLVAKADEWVSIGDNGSNCTSVEAIQDNCPPVITTITLIEAVTDQDILDLYDWSGPTIINTLQFGTALNFRANVVGNVGSVVFQLDGAIYSKENIAPYALFGDDPIGDYRSGMFAPGRHTLIAIPYAEKNGKGNPGFSTTIEFIVVDQALAVIRFYLVNSENDLYLGEIKEGSTISLQQVDNTKLNILAETYLQPVGSVVFDLNGVKNFRTENTDPYLLAGDDPRYNYNDYTFTPGTYHLTATPYSMPKGRGEAGQPLSITFEVVDNAETTMAARTIATTSSKAVEGKADNISVAQHAAKVRLYPNPAGGKLTIQMPDTKQDAINLYLYNAQGHKVMETTGESKASLSLDVSHLAAGMYVLKVASAHLTEMHRVLLK